MAGIAIKDLKELARDRLEETEILFARKKFGGAMHICVYALECAFKYRICRTLNWKSYPPEKSLYESERGEDSFRNFKTHEPMVLLLLSGQFRLLHDNAKMLVAWDIVKNLKTEIRYEITPKKKTLLEMQNEAKKVIKAAKKVIRFLGINF